MEHLTGINIRTGLEELNIPIHEIFKNKTEPVGDPRIKELYKDGSKKIFSKYPDLEENVDAFSKVVFYDKKTAYKVTDDLNAYTFDCYELFKDPKKGDRSVVTKRLEIEFINDQILDFDHFCFNLMSAQAFTGKYETPEYLYPFIGMGNFELDDYANVHSMVMNTNCNLVFFFIYYKKVVSGIYHFTSANYGQDIKEQKKFLSNKEYKSAMRTFNTHKRIIAQSLFGDTTFDPGYPISDENESNDDE